MKITKHADRVKYLKEVKEKANEGCNVCPCCGETRTFWECCKTPGKSQGVSYGYCVTWVTLFPRCKAWRKDCYSCDTCGAEWESDKYEWV